MEQVRSAFKILTGTPKGMRPLGRPRRRWEDNIRLNFKEIGINMRYWVLFGSGWGLLEIPCKCDIESPGSISHGVS